METAIGEVLPLALGVAISPIPIIAAILMLLAPGARGRSVGFLVGWVLGIVVAVVLFTLLATVIPPSDPNDSAPVAGVVKIALGVLLLLLAVKQWRGRPHGDEEPALPKWMAAIDSLTAVRAVGLGFLLSAVNPKNLLMAASAGVIVGTAGLTAGEITLTLAVYVLIAASTVLIPVLGYLVASRRLAAPLERLRGWLVHNNATVMAVLLLVIGVAVIGKGIASF
ncbi:GAP family protein [Microbacterium sp. CFBP9034]|uniref:GAP family protein n=1 Tax=Microbacterium sp. CFBP9034 TaxID=3096540 RepID=UPI002A6B1B40|nr:GAP family protein [Microbacterium sp. CFBP9034]MDY0909826.1 GAP family protein [Microbacterium sp. CFBP9034]